MVESSFPWTLAFPSKNVDDQIAYINFYICHSFPFSRDLRAYSQKYWESLVPATGRVFSPSVSRSGDTFKKPEPREESKQG